MIWYILVFSIIAVFCSLDVLNVDVNVRSVFAILVCLLLSFFLGFRNQTGPDWDEYAAFYSETPRIYELLTNFDAYSYLPIEIGYLLTSSIFKSFYFGFNGFIFFIAFLTVYLTYISLKDYSKFILFGLLLFVYYGYFSAFSAIRQALATAIFLYSARFILNRQLGRYVLTISAAFLFHYSAVILLPLYFILNRRVNNFVILLIVGLCILISKTNGLLYLTQLLTLFVGSPILLVVTSKYLSNLNEVSNAAFGSIFYEWFVLLIILLIYRKEVIARSAYANIFLNIFWMGLVVYLLFSSFGAFGRAVMYFKVAYLILIPLTISLFKESSGRSLCYLIATIVVGLRCYVGIIGDSNNTVTFENRFLPYKNVLFDEN